MAYVFKFKGLTSQLQVLLNKATIPNYYVKNSCQAWPVNNPLATGEQAVWVLPDNPLGNGVVSKPFKLYNPWAGVYLADTEQTYPLTGFTPPVAATVAGDISFASDDLAPCFVFQKQANGSNAYKIYISDNENNLTGKPRLIIDKVNSNRVVISVTDFTATSTLDDIFHVAPLLP